MENESETGNWNINLQYIQILAGHLGYIKLYKEIAKFGSSDIFEDFETIEKNKPIIRLKALERYIYHLKELVNDTKFAVQDKKEDNKKYEEYYKSLTFYQEEVLPVIRIKITNREKTEIGINEIYFDWLFDKLDKIDMDLKSPLNKNDLLFNYREKFDPKAWKDKIKEDFTEGG